MRWLTLKVAGSFCGQVLFAAGLLMVPGLAQSQTVEVSAPSVSVPTTRRAVPRPRSDFKHTVAQVTVVTETNRIDGSGDAVAAE